MTMEKWLLAMCLVIHLGVALRTDPQDRLTAEAEAGNERLNLQRSVTPEETTIRHNLYRGYDEVRKCFVKLRGIFESKGIIRFDETGKTLPLGNTYENRTIHHVELGTVGKPVIMIEVNIHAQEWTTSASTFYMIDRLLTGYGSDKDADFLLDNYHLVIIPIANPDGYEYTRTEQRKKNQDEYRLWQKNRRPQYEGCVGVDLNRNFDYRWENSSNCDKSYPGPSAFSEAETQAIQTLFNAYKDDVVIYLSIHSYSQLIIVPMIYAKDDTPVNEFHKTAGKAVADAMSGVDNHTHLSGTVWDKFKYSAYGTSTDWALTQKVKEEDLATDRSFLSIILVVRPEHSSSNGFVQPPSEIIPTGREVLAGVLAAARAYSNKDQAV